MKIDPNDPAFPYAAEWGYKPGLPIRAELAARFMHAILSNQGHLIHHAEDVAREAVFLSDALISELNKSITQ